MRGTEFPETERYAEKESPVAKPGAESACLADAHYCGIFPRGAAGCLVHARGTFSPAMTAVMGVRAGAVGGDLPQRAMVQ